MAMTVPTKIHRVFGYRGDGINGIVGALGRAGNDPQFIQARHEEMAACDGMRRAGVAARSSRGLAGHGRGGRRVQLPHPDRQATDCRAVHTAEVLAMALHRD